MTKRFLIRNENFSYKKKYIFLQETGNFLIRKRIVFLGITDCLPRENGSLSQGSHFVLFGKKVCQIRNISIKKLLHRKQKS